MGTPEDSASTRAKLIQAAGLLFAARGMNGVTVRDIVSEAGTSLSALNYHFGSKDALYREVLLAACASDAISESEREQLLTLKPRSALTVFVREALKAYLEREDARWESAVIDRECRDPSPVFAEILREHMAPEIDLIAEIIGNAVGKKKESHEARFAALGLIGLLSILGQYTHLVDGVAPGLREKCLSKDWAVDRIVSMTLEGAR